MFNKNDKSGRTAGSSAFLVDLKAELYRKKQEAKQGSSTGSGFKAKSDLDADAYAHAQSSGVNVINAAWNVKAKEIEQTIRSSVARKQNERNRSYDLISENRKRKEKLDESVQGEEQDEELQRQLQLSRQRLEEKSRLYEQKKQEALQAILSNKSCDERPDDQELVNFDDKVMYEHRHGLMRNPDADLIEYVDSFGRVRKCRTDELERLRQMDEELATQRVLTTNLNRIEQYGLNEMARKQNDESDDDEKASADLASTYQSVSKHEIREHGTSYIQFSTSSEERKKQMESLEQTHQSLKADIDKSKAIKQKQDSALRERLARIARRRGLIAEDEGAECPFLDKFAGSNESERLAEQQQAAEREQLQQEIREEKVDAMRRRMAKRREWDDGKDCGQTFVPASDHKKLRLDEREAVSRSSESCAKRPPSHSSDSDSDQEIEKFLSDTFEFAAQSKN